MRRLPKATASSVVETLGLLSMSHLTPSLPKKLALYVCVARGAQFFVQGSLAFFSAVTTVLSGIARPSCVLCVVTATTEA